MSPRADAVLHHAGRANGDWDLGEKWENQKRYQGYEMMDPRQALMGGTNRAWGFQIQERTRQLRLAEGAERRWDLEVAGQK